jgi:hypothetical protein
LGLQRQQQWVLAVLEQLEQQELGEANMKRI